MGEQLMAMYNSLPVFAQQEAFDFISFLKMKFAKKDAPAKKKEKLMKYFGTLSDEDAKIMMGAVDECRKIEGSDEW